MEFCCPSPNAPVIYPNETNIKHRSRLRYLMFGEISLIIVKSILYGPMQAVFQFINVWIVYVAWATMHFCNTLFYLFITAIGLVLAIL